ncbi:MAG: PAS domain S-box protein, partial [Proteobacteria bacterium]|nr:PAS domain S-box protein [Pseudomonadota bacterium]
MKPAPIPANEKERLAELRRYEVLDTAQEKIFDDITDLARTICRTKICVISLVDQDRQWFKSVQGLEARETPRDVSFCGHAIHHEEIFEIENSLADERFKDNPLCVSAPNVIFYAGAPLITPQGFKIGTLCVIDDKPGKLDPTQRQLLQQLSKQVINYLELQRKEMELKLSHIKLDRIVNHIPVILSLYNEKGEFQWCNRAWERELGWSASEMQGRDMLAEFYPDPLKRQEVIDFMMKPGDGWHEFRTRTKSGDFIFTSWANVSLPNGWTVGIGKNIDENKKSQEATELQNQRNQMILEGAGLGSWDWWLDSNQLSFDRQWCEMLGLDITKTPMNLATWQQHMHPDDIEGCKREIQRHLSGETEHYESVHRMRHADGHWVYILDRGRISERDSTGKPIRFTGTHFDLTNQKRIEQSLLDYKRKTETIFESSNDAIILLHDGVILETNRKGLEIFGYENFEEMRHRHPGELSPELQPDGRRSLEASQELIEFLKVNNTHRFDWVHKKKNGETFEVDIVASTFELEGKRITQATIRDLSKERREQRKNLSFYNALLEMSNLDSRTNYLEKIHFILEKVAQTLDCSQVSYWDYFEDRVAIKSL